MVHSRSLYWLRYPKTVNKTLMCVANVHKFNKYCIHIIVYIQLFLFVPHPYWHEIPYISYFYAKCTTAQWSDSHGFLSTKVSLFAKSSPASWTWRHWLCTLLPLSWCFSLQKKIHCKNCGTKESRKRMSTENWSTCGMRQKDVCGFDTSWLILMDTWVTIVATFQYGVPVVIWQKYLYSCLDVSCQDIWSCSSYTVQFLCWCFPTESNWRLAFSWFIA